MKVVYQSLSKHPISIIFYALYAWIVISEYLRTREIEWKISHGEITHMQCGIPPFFFMGSVFTIVIMVNILAKKNEMKFYSALLILIIIPLIVLGNMN